MSGQLNRPEEERLYNDIETALSMMHRKESPDELMTKIRQMFPSPVFFLESNVIMKQKAGMRYLDAFHFSMFPELARYTTEEKYRNSTRLNHLSLMAEYLVNLYKGIHRERFYAILLDRIGRKKRTVLISKGSDDAAMFDLKLMLAKIVEYGAKAVVICHNHPGGTMRPSEEDVQCTLSALRALKALNVPLVDHIIIAYERAISMRDLASVPAELWTMQAPKSKLLREWIDVDLFKQYEKEDNLASQAPQEDDDDMEEELDDLEFQLDELDQKGSR